MNKTKTKKPFIQRYNTGFYRVNVNPGLYVGTEAARLIVAKYAEPMNRNLFAMYAGFIREYSDFKKVKFYSQLRESDQFQRCIQKMKDENEQIGLAVFERRDDVAAYLQTAVFIVFTN
jgi:predicted sulfurtransferase